MSRSILIRMFLALAVVAVTMAVSCPQPQPEPDPDPEPETKTLERKHFEQAVVEGLYVKDARVLTYEPVLFQRARNPKRMNYRIQSDDQTQYLDIHYSGHNPTREGEEVECEVHYRLEEGETTTLIVKFIVIQATEEYIWLWNEFQEVGVIVHKL